MNTTSYNFNPSIMCIFVFQKVKTNLISCIYNKNLSFLTIQLTVQCYVIQHHVRRTSSGYRGIQNSIQRANNVNHLLHIFDSTRYQLVQIMYIAYILSNFLDMISFKCFNDFISFSYFTFFNFCFKSQNYLLITYAFTLFRKMHE